MLRLTDAQQLALNSARSTFNQSETALAARIASSGGLQGNAAPVGPEAWRRIDDRAITIQRDVLAVFGRLAAASTTPMSMGDLVNYYPQMSDSGEVTVTLDGRQTGRSDQANIKYDGTPLPVLASEARFGWRQMEVLRKGGMAIDTETIANHQRKVLEKLEDMALNGDANVVLNGTQIYGVRNHPNRNTFSHTFTLATATGAQWLTTMLAMLNQLIGDNAYGRVTVFLNYGDWLAISVNEFVAGYPKTILQRLREIEQIADIVPASKMPASNIVGIAGLDGGSWGSILSGMPMVTKPKMRANAEDDYVFTVMAAMAPQFRVDFNGQMAVAHGVT
jgi:uncharacterized linocin/CFP29 family protein